MALPLLLLFWPIQVAQANTLFDWCLEEVRCFSPNRLYSDPCSNKRPVIDQTLTQHFNQVYQSIGLDRPEWLQAGNMAAGQGRRQLGNLNCRGTTQTTGWSSS